MKKTSIYNNLSSKLLKEAQLKKGEVVEFHSVKKRQKPWQPGSWQIPTWQVPSTDVIYDPHDDQWKDIAFIKTLLPNDQCELAEIWVGPENRPIPGAIVLSGDNPKDRELYTYLYLSNYWDRADRDESKDLVLKMVIPKEEALKKSDKRRKLVEAAGFAAAMKREDIVALAAAKGKDPDLDIEILKDFVEEYAVSDPEAFLHEAKSNRTTVKSKVRRCENLKHIYWDASASAWKWSATKEQIVSVPRNLSKERYEYITSFIIENEKGPSVLDSIDSLLS